MDCRSLINNGDSPQVTRIAIVLGTRSDAIKLAPVIWEISKRNELQEVIISTGQHKEMLDQMLRCFEIAPNVDVSAMRNGQSLTELTSKMVHRLGKEIQACGADLVAVHGDTATAFCGALAAFYAQKPIVHIEAGLRSGSIGSPFPEEAHRRFIDMVADIHFCSTDGNRRNLLREGISEKGIFVTGNTVIDSLNWARGRGSDLPSVSRERPYRALVTVHRRENHGLTLHNIAAAIRRIAARGDIEVVLPLHLNPAVRETLLGTLSEVPGVIMCDPMNYPDFISLLESCTMVLTDSGGLQEEAATLGKPVLVLNRTTERPEAMSEGSTWIVGTDIEHISSMVDEIIKKTPASDAIPVVARNLFGDGQASKRIADILTERIGA
ncbi:non-hydrolyzing UDP-N-acetylglucosamine 2-epimerase [Streptomyces sp. NPDC059649]|uniref:non-hydrolyzing UDP-N-acetylglucosamine 2-epimerase n=1 Tax=Streptomyces sp. NPDC059649 TaxID=3346895 RepID=UPI003696E77D